MQTIIFSDGKSAALLWQDGKLLTNGYVTGFHLQVGEVPQIAATIFGDPEWAESEKPVPDYSGVCVEDGAFVLPELRIQRVKGFDLSFADAARGIVPEFDTRWITMQKPIWIEIPPLFKNFTPKITYTRRYVANDHSGVDRQDRRRCQPVRQADGSHEATGEVCFRGV